VYVGSLFSGIGGIELGFEREGFETRWFVEIDEYCQRVLRKHWPNTPIYSDIRAVDFSRLERIDVLTGGFPCQDISTANPKGKGLEGERSGLWSYYKEAIRVLRPKYAVIENVPNLVGWFDTEARPTPPEIDVEGGEWSLEVEQIQALTTVLTDLASCGYDAEWNVVSARGAGARHLRRRIFIIAYPMAHSCGTGTGHNTRPSYEPGNREEMLRPRREVEADWSDSAGTDAVHSTDKRCWWNDKCESSGDRTPNRKSGEGTVVPTGGESDVADPEGAERERSGDTRARGAGFTDGGTDVADTGCPGVHERREFRALKRGSKELGRVFGDGLSEVRIGEEEDMANTHAARLQGHGQSLDSAGELFAPEARIQLAELRAANERGIWRCDPADLGNSERFRCNGHNGKLRSTEEEGRVCELEGSASWTTEPYVGRMVAGVPARVDRLRCLGNAVVPQVAQFIARRIRAQFNHSNITRIGGIYERGR